MKFALTQARRRAKAAALTREPQRDTPLPEKSYVDPKTVKLSRAAKRRWREAKAAGRNGWVPEIAMRQSQE